MDTEDLCVDTCVRVCMCVRWVGFSRPHKRSSTADRYLFEVEMLADSFRLSAFAGQHLASRGLANLLPYNASDSTTQTMDLTDGALPEPRQQLSPARRRASVSRGRDG